MASDLHKAIPPYKPKGKEEYMNPRQQKKRFNNRKPLVSQASAG